MIDLDHVFAEVERIAETRDIPERIGRTGQIGRWELGEEVLHVGRSNRVNGCGWKARSVSGARTSGAIAICPLRTNHVAELSAGHPRIGNCGGGIGIGNDSPGFLRHKEERLIALLVDFWNPYWAAECATEVVIAQPGTRRNRRHTRREQHETR